MTGYDLPEPIIMQDKNHAHLMLYQYKSGIHYSLTMPPHWRPADEYAEAGNWCIVHNGFIKKKMKSIISMFEDLGFKLREEKK